MMTDVCIWALTAAIAAAVVTCAAFGTFYAAAAIAGCECDEEESDA